MDVRKSSEPSKRYINYELKVAAETKIIFGEQSYMRAKYTS